MLPLQGAWVWSLTGELLLLLLICFSRVQLCATPQRAAHQAPPSLGFSRQEHWSELPFLLRCTKVKSESEVTRSCPTLRDPMDCSPLGFSVHGIFQARGLEWGAIALSALGNWDLANSAASLLNISFRTVVSTLKTEVDLQFSVFVLTLVLI